MYVSFNPETETVTMISFPRDLYVFIPGWKVWRINGAWNQGGEEMLAQTFLYNFGLEVDQYILVDFTGFTGIINSVGGIDVSVGNSFVDECRGIEWSYLAGKTYHMDGDEALCYVRMRAATSDFARKERQAEIIVALFKKIGSLTGFRNVDELYSQYTQSVESDIGLTQVVNFAPIAVKLLKDDWRIQSTTITEEYVTNWRTPDEQAVLLPKVGAIQKLLEDALTK
jgi:LCP family protein required for cell wall assembly